MFETLRHTSTRRRRRRQKERLHEGKKCYCRHRNTKHVVNSYLPLLVCTSEIYATHHKKLVSKRDEDISNRRVRRSIWKQHVCETAWLWDGRYLILFILVCVRLKASANALHFSLMEIDWNLFVSMPRRFGAFSPENILRPVVVHIVYCCLYLHWRCDEKFVSSPEKIFISLDHFERKHPIYSWKNWMQNWILNFFPSIRYKTESIDINLPMNNPPMRCINLKLCPFWH